MKKSSKSQFSEISKENFINFLASSTPEEVSRYILEKGKPPKLIEPVVFFKDKQHISHNE